MKKIIMLLALAGLVGNAQAAVFNFAGNITYNTDVVRIDFSLNQAATNVRVWTDSFQSGLNFDPITALWDSNGQKIGENDDDATINPSTQTYFDSGFSLASLAAGSYSFTVAAFSNFAGTSLSDPFDYAGQTPIAIPDWCQPASDNCNNQKGTYWSVWLDGVDNATNPNDPGNRVPEPASIALVGLGLAGLAALRRRKVD